MYYRTINKEIKVALSIPQFAEQLFELTSKNREHLKEWLPWLDSIKKASDTKDFIRTQLNRFTKGEALHQTIFYHEKIAGVIGFNCIDQTNNVGHLGYWLGKEYTGKGIMSLVTADLINLGFNEFPIQKIEIRCATTNIKSRAIPERLGFKNEGTLRKAEKVYDKYFDMVVYGLLKNEKLC